MNLRYLKTFIAVADHGNFARAANAVGLTQSAVSMQIQTLESLLGIQLFDRTQRPAALNEHGKAMIRRAREIVELYGALINGISTDDNLPAVLHLGTVRSTMSGIMPRSLAALNAQFPSVRLNLVHGLSADLIKRLEEGLLDGVLVSEPQYFPPQLRWTPIMEEPLVVIAAADALGDSFDELLMSYPYIGLDRGDWGGRLISDYLHSRGIVLRPSLEFDTVEAVIMMVQRGLGVSILHQGCIDNPLRLMLRSIPFGDPPLSRRLGLLCRPEGQRAMLFDALTQSLGRMAAEQRAVWWPLTA